MKAAIAVAILATAVLASFWAGVGPLPKSLQGAADVAAVAGGSGHDHAAQARAGQDPSMHDHSAHTGGGAAPAQEQALRPQIPDPVLVDQNGREHRFYSDLVQGKLVLMNAIYTSCQGSCPIQTTVFSRVHDSLGDRVGQDVQMISVSLDPVTDTPERLREFIQKQKLGDPGDGWIFLTGARQDVIDVLQAMDLYSPVPEEHTPIAAIGNEPAGLWMKTINLTAPLEIVKRLDYVKRLGDERAAAAAGE